MTVTIVEGSEEALFFVKPDNEGIWGGVFNYFEGQLCQMGKNWERGCINRIKGVREGLILAHYDHVRHLSSFGATISAFVQGKIYLTSYRGDTGLIAVMREVLGPTDPKEARRTHPFSVRSVFSEPGQTRDLTLLQGIYLNNVAHCSDLESAQREMALWKEYLLPQ